MPKTNMEKECIVCASNIPKNAKKCLHCNSYQNWQRYIDFSNTTIALLIALITVISLVTEKFVMAYKELSPQTITPNVIRAVTEIDIDSASILYTNLGDNRAVLDDVIICRIPIAKKDSPYIKQAETSLTIPDQYPMGSEVEKSNMLVFISSNKEHLLESGESVIIKYHIHQRRYEAGKPFNEDAAQIPGFCSINVQDIEGKDHTEFIKLSKVDTFGIQEKLRKNPTYGYDTADKTANDD